MADTTYIVLRRDDNTPDGEFDHYHYVRSIEAPSASQAIRKFAAAQPGDASGTYIAVPQRSWKPVQVTAVQTTTLKLEQPS